MNIRTYPRQLRQRITRAHMKVQEEVFANAKGGRLAAAMAGEGYAGGYRDALSDVVLLMNGVIPQTRHYWDD